METWSAHQLFDRAKQNLGAELARNLQQYAQRLMRANLPVIFTLGHLAELTGTPYSVLQATVERRREAANYRTFTIAKRSGGRRLIHAVSGHLFRTQQVLNSEVLQSRKPHPASFAFHSTGGIRKCAAMHCGARWLFQFDLQNFFYSVNEIDVFRIFAGMGYRPLLAFELARICTTVRVDGHHLEQLTEASGRYAFYGNRSGFLGVLPQGAPTSPMLANLAATELDNKLTSFAERLGFVYTRYADDITISATDLPERVSVGHIIHVITSIIRRCGFKENRKKIRVAGPGAKKVVLGLLVDGEGPRITKEMYKRIDRHLHAVSRYGLVDVAHHEGFDSAFGFLNHLSGLIAYVKDVDCERWSEFSTRLSQVEVPWSQ